MSSSSSRSSSDFDDPIYAPIIVKKRKKVKEKIPKQNENAEIRAEINESELVTYRRVRKNSYSSSDNEMEPQKSKMDDKSKIIKPRREFAKLILSTGFSYPFCLKFFFQFQISYHLHADMS